MFEIQAIEQSYLLEKEAAALADKDKSEKARELLTNFVQKKCDEAITSCEKMLDFFRDLPILTKKS